MGAAPIIGAGINLLGGLLGGRSARRAEARQRAMAIEDQAEQFVRLRDAAEKAGFNPLTALQANPTGGMVNPTPALASGQFVADALGSATSTYFNMKQQERDVERDALEKALMREELKAMQMQGKALEKRMQFGYEIPQANNYSGVDTVNKWPPLSENLGAKRTSGYVLNGKWVFTDPDFVDAETWEQRYGELGAEAYGATVAAADLAYQEKARRFGGDAIHRSELPRLAGIPVSESKHWWFK